LQTIYAVLAFGKMTVTLGKEFNWNICQWLVSSTSCNKLVFYLGACVIVELTVCMCLFFYSTSMCCRQESWSTARASLCPFCQAARESCGMSGEHSSGVCWAGVCAEPDCTTLWVWTLYIFSITTVIHRMKGIDMVILWQGLKERAGVTNDALQVVRYLWTYCALFSPSNAT